MSDNIPRDLQIALCGSSNIADPRALRLPPIDQISLLDSNAVKTYVNGHSHANSFLILFWNPDDRQADTDLEYLRRRKNVFAIFVCVRRKDHFNFNGEKVYPVARQFIRQKLTAAIVQFFQQTAADLLRNNHYYFARECMKHAHDFKAQLRSGNRMLTASHVSIIFMNVAENLSFEIHERVIDACNDLCAEYEPRVYTLDYYFESGDDPRMFGDKYLAFIRRFIRTVGGIQIYVFGNETSNLHTFSQLLFEGESNSLDECEYDERPIFMEHEPVTAQTRSNMSKMFGSGWSWENVQFKRLDNLRTELKFLGALERVNRTVVERTRALNDELNRQAMDPSENSIQISGSYQVIQQATTDSPLRIATVSEDISDMIQESPNQ